MIRRLLLTLLCWGLACPLGWAGASRSFDGTDDKVQIADYADGDAENLTICIWLKTTATGERAMYGKWSAGGGEGYPFALRMANTTSYPFIAIYDATNNPSATGTTDLNGGTWFFVCGTRNTTADQLEIFVNCVSEATATDSTTGTESNASAITIGTQRQNADIIPWSGTLAYGSHYNRVLSAAEQCQIMHFPGSITNSLTHFLPLFGTDSPEIDLSGNGRTGTVTGAIESSDGPPVYLSSPLAKVWNRLMKYVFVSSPYRRNYTQWS